jgi:hypothetical protein
MNKLAIPQCLPYGLMPKLSMDCLPILRIWSNGNCLLAHESDFKGKHGVTDTEITRLMVPEMV